MGLMADRLPPPRIDAMLGPLADLQRSLSTSDTTTRFQVALVASLVLHALLVLFIGIKDPARNRDHNISPPLEVVLVNSRSATAPTQADALAQANLDGGGTTEAERRAKSPLPVVRREDPSPEIALQTRKLEELEREAKRLMTQIKQDAAAVEQPEPRPQPQAEKVDAPTAADIMRRSVEVARLEAQISKDWDAYQKRPRRRFVGARTQEFRFARYVEDWRAKIERVGTLNYPSMARDQRIFGSLQLTVAIRSDGTVDAVEINRSSGQRVLDEAAIRIVNLAAPFAAFPPDIAKDTDVLSITRTWTFTRADQFQAD
jgi:protein TonB